MSTEGELVYDPQSGKVITRLKQADQETRQECEEKDRCIKHAEEILRKVSKAHP